LAKKRKNRAKAAWGDLDCAQQLASNAKAYHNQVRSQEIGCNCSGFTGITQCDPGEFFTLPGECKVSFVACPGCQAGQPCQRYKEKCDSCANIESLGDYAAEMQVQRDEAEAELISAEAAVIKATALAISAEENARIAVKRSLQEVLLAENEPQVASFDVEDQVPPLRVRDILSGVVMPIAPNMAGQ
jgi:hypothetical protein